MRERLKLFKRKIGEATDKGANKLLDKYINIGIAFENVLNKSDSDEEGNEEVDEDELDLELLHDFMSDYIGMIIMGIKGFSDDTILTESKDVQYKIISGCEISKESIIFQLSGVTGVTSGYLELSPSKNGSFAERDPSDIPLYSSRYRIFFYGGDTLEYLDSEKLGSIEYRKTKV